jgi:hypothetical protein
MAADSRSNGNGNSNSVGRGSMSSVCAGGVAVPKVFAVAVSAPFRRSQSVASAFNAFEVAVAVVAAFCGHLRFQQLPGPIERLGRLDVATAE